MSERDQVASHLTLRERIPFCHPKTAYIPTVDVERRYQLEKLWDFNLNMCYPDLSPTATALVLGVIRSLISQRTYAATFAMSQLHGFSNSKCTMWDYGHRASQRTMADMGALVDDLEDLEGLEGDQMIEACKAWCGYKQPVKIELYTNNWDRRFYWINDDGSHHMAVLCYQLQQQAREWRPDVEIQEAVLDVAPLQQLEGKVSVFVVIDDHSNQVSIFNELPSSLQCPNVEEALGVLLADLATPEGTSDCQLLLVDHSRAYSDLGLNGAQALVDAGYAISFLDYLLAWQAPTPPVLADRPETSAAPS